MTKNINSGQVMIESLIAISLGMVGLLGILALVSRSLYLQNDLQQQFSANYLAAEGIELVRSLIDENYKKDLDGDYLAGDPWGEARVRFSSDSSYEVSYEGEPSRSLILGSLRQLSEKNGLYGYFEDGSETPYQRKIEVIKSDDVSIQIISTVSWISRDEEKSVSLEDVFYNWR